MSSSDQASNASVETHTSMEVNVPKEIGYESDSEIVYNGFSHDWLFQFPDRWVTEARIETKIDHPGYPSAANTDHQLVSLCIDVNNKLTELKHLYLYNRNVWENATNYMTCKVADLGNCVLAIRIHHQNASENFLDTINEINDAVHHFLDYLGRDWNYMAEQSYS
jgi:hypothetical protein